MVSPKGNRTSIRGISKLAHNLYRVRIRVEDLNGTLRSLDKQIEGNLTKAKQYQQEWKLRLKEVPITGDLVSGHILNWFQLKKDRNELTPATLDKYNIAITKHFVPSFGSLPLDALSTDVIEKWVSKCRREGHKANTINSNLAILSNILSGLQSNPVKGVKRVRVNDARITKTEPNSLTKDELSTFLSCAFKLYPQHYPMICLMFFTGLRIGNLLVLKWSDIQEDEMLNVQRRLSKNKIIAGTKTGKDLSYPLPAELLFILLKHKKSLIKQQLVNDYVFPNIQGDHHSRSILKLPFL